jgi:hypothetical protein
MTEEEIALMKADMKKEQDGFGRWTWLACIDKLAQGDITKFDAVCRQNFIACLNLLSYWLEKEKRIEKMQEQLNRETNTIK